MSNKPLKKEFTNIKLHCNSEEPEVPQLVGKSNL